MTPVIEKATRNDIDSIIKMQAKLLALHEPFSNKYKTRRDATLIFKKYLKGLINKKDAVIFLAKENRKSIGYAIVKVNDLPPIFEISKEARITDLFVESQHRSKGIGEALISASINWAKKKKLSLVSLIADVKNTTAIDFYKKQKFKVRRLTMVKNVSP